MIVIYALEETIALKRQQLSDAIHHSMCEVFKLPENKRFHRFMPMKAENYFYSEDRSKDYTVIEVRMMEGRSKALIKQFIYYLFEQVEAVAGILPQDVEITIMTQPSYCWGFRGVVGEDAQLNYSLAPGE